MGDEKAGKSNDIAAVMQRHQSLTSGTEMGAKKRSQNPSRELGVAPLAEKSLLGTQPADQRGSLPTQDPMLLAADPNLIFGAAAAILTGVGVLSDWFGLGGVFAEKNNGVSISSVTASYPSGVSLVGGINSQTTRKVLTVNYVRPRTNQRGNPIDGSRQVAKAEIGVRGKFGTIDPKVAEANGWPSFVYLIGVEFVILKSEGWNGRSLDITMKPGNMYGKQGFVNVGNDWPRMSHEMTAILKSGGNTECQFDGVLLTTHVKSFFSDQNIIAAETNSGASVLPISYDDSAGHTTITVQGVR